MVQGWFRVQGCSGFRDVQGSGLFRVQGCSGLFRLVVQGSGLFHTTARELQTCTSEGPSFRKHQQNSTPKRDKKSEKVGQESEKRAKIWAVPRMRVRRRGGGSKPTTHNNTRQHTTPTTTHANTNHNTTQLKNGLAKNGSAKVGHNRERASQKQKCHKG